MNHKLFRHSYRPAIKRAFMLCLACILALAGPGAPAANATIAATYTVTSLADAGPGTLRQAILDANAVSGRDEITFNVPEGATIVLAAPLPPIFDDVIIAGPGAAKLAVSGNNQVRVFTVLRGTVSIMGLTIKNGKAQGGAGGAGINGAGGGGGAGLGGGILVNGGAVTLANMIFSANTVAGGPGGDGAQGGLKGGAGGGGAGGIGGASDGGAAGGGGFLGLGGGGAKDLDGKAIGGGGGGFTGRGGGKVGVATDIGGGGAGFATGAPAGGGGDGNALGAGGGGGSMGFPGASAGADASAVGGAGGFGGGGGGAQRVGGAGGAGGDYGGGGGGMRTAGADDIGGAGGFGGGGGGSANHGGAGGFGGGGGGASVTGGTAGAGGTLGGAANGANAGGGAGLGGAVFVRAGQLVLIHTVFDTNSATSGAGGKNASTGAGQRGRGKGGALYVSADASAISVDAAPSFSGNTAEDAGSTATDNANQFGTIAVQPAQVGAAAGNNQTAVVNTAFSTQLQVLITAGGAPVAGMPVTFRVTAGASGASATFPGNETSVKRYTDSTGHATAPGLTANGIVGAYSVTANAGLANSARFNLNNVAGAPAHVVAVSGAPQHIRINTAFEARLQARVVDVNNLPVVNAKVTFSAPAAGPSAIFPSGGATASAQTNDNGVATAPIMTANAFGGSYFVTAMVDGVGAPAVFSLTNDKAIGSITLASAPNPSGVGIPVALEARVQTKLGVVPTGAVTFLDGNVTLGSSVLNSGVAKMTVPELTIGAHALTAAYSGDASFTDALSAPITHTVSRRNTQARLDVAPNPSYIGHVVFFTATVSSSKGVPDGIVVFQDGDTTLATDTLNNGMATFATSAMALGNHVLTAKYQGTETWAPANSSVVTETVILRPTKVKIHSGPDAAPAGIRVTIVATVTSVSGVPDGNVVFKDGAEVIASIPLVDGVAVLATTDLTVGDHTLKAEYQGTGIFERSASGNILQSVIKHGTQTFVGAAPNPSSVGHLITFSIMVMPDQNTKSGDAMTDIISGPTGKVHLTSSADAINVKLDLVNGAATFATDALRAGKYTISAKYLGDANYAVSNAPTIEQIVEPAVMAVNDAAGTLQGTPVKIAVLANDIDPLHGGLAVALAENATHGTLKINGDNTVTYAPAAAFAGVDTFEYVVRDVKGNIDRAKVTVVVSAHEETNVAPQIAVIDPAVGATIPFRMNELAADFKLPSGVYTDTLADQDALFFAFTALVTPTHTGDGLPPDVVYGGGSFNWNGFVNNAPISSEQLRQPVELKLTYALEAESASAKPLMQLLHWTGTAWSSDGITVIENNPAAHSMVVQTNVLGELGLFSAPALPAGVPLYLPMVQR